MRVYVYDCRYVERRVFGKIRLTRQLCEKSVVIRDRWEIDGGVVESFPSECFSDLVWWKLKNSISIYIRSSF